MNKAFIIFAIIFLVFFLFSSFVVCATDYVGVQVGDSWNFKILECSIPTDVVRTGYSITAVSGSIVTWHYIYYRIDGTIFQQGSGSNDVSKPFDQLDVPYVDTKMALTKKNTQLGDLIILEGIGSDGYVTEVVSKSYWGQIREVNIVKFRYIVGDVEYRHYTFYFDKSSGILCESIIQSPDNTILFHEVVDEYNQIPEFLSTYLFIFILLSSIMLFYKRKFLIGTFFF